MKKFWIIFEALLRLTCLVVMLYSSVKGNWSMTAAFGVLYLITKLTK